MSTEELARRIARTEEAYSSFGCRVVDHKKYKTIKYSDCMHGWNVNQVRELNCLDCDGENLISEIEKDMDWPHRQFCIHTDFRTIPQSLSKSLRQAGYSPVPILTQVFGGEKLKKDIGQFDIVSVNEKNAHLWEDMIASMYAGNSRGENFSSDMIQFGTDRMSLSPLDEKFSILLCIDGDVAVGQAEVYTKDNVTTIGNIFVRPKYRQKNIATNLVYAGIDYAKELASDIVYLVTYSFDTPRYAYAKMGFNDLMEGILWAKVDDEQLEWDF